MTAESWYFTLTAIGIMVAVGGLIANFRNTQIKREDSKRKDVLIATANRQAADANQQAAEANKTAAESIERANKLENDNLKLREDLNAESGKVAGLQKAASDALAEQQRVQKELEIQRGRTATLEKDAAEAKAAQLRVETELENAKTKAANAIEAANQAAFAAFKEKWEREQMESQSYPRKLSLGREGEYIDRLRVYAGTEVYFVTLPDTEPTRTTQMIANLLASSGWKVLGIEQIPGASERAIPDGVWVETNGPVVTTPPHPLLPAIETLRDVLNDSKIFAQRSFLNQWLPPDKLPPNTVRVVVGLRPDWHFTNKKFQRESEQDSRRKAIPRISQPPK